MVGFCIEIFVLDGFHDCAGVVCEQRRNVVFEINGEAALLAVGVPVVGVQVDGGTQQAGLVDDGGVVADDGVGDEQGVELAARDGDDAWVVDDLLAHGMRLVNEVEAIEVDGIDERGRGLGLIGGRLLAEGGAVDDGLAPAQLRVGGKDGLALSGAVLLVQQEVDSGEGRLEKRALVGVERGGELVGET